MGTNGTTARKIPQCLLSSRLGHGERRPERPRLYSGSSWICMSSTVPCTAQHGYDNSGCKPGLNIGQTAVADTFSALLLLSPLSGVTELGLCQPGFEPCCTDGCLIPGGEHDYYCSTGRKP